MNNQFQVYDQLRAYQLHCERLEGKNIKVPTHEAYHPNIPKLDRAKQYHRFKKFNQIEEGNKMMMNKLIDINKRQSKHSQSSPNLSLPPIKQKKFQVPRYEQENGEIARRIIDSKPSIRTKEQIKFHRKNQQHKRLLRKYEMCNGFSIPRKSYIANMLILKKLKGSRVINPQQF